MEGYGVIVSGEKRIEKKNVFVEPACLLLASNSFEVRAKVSQPPLDMVDMMPNSM